MLFKSTNKYRIIKKPFKLYDEGQVYVYKDYGILQQAKFWGWETLKMVSWDNSINTPTALKDWLVTELKSNNTEIIEEFYL